MLIPGNESLYLKQTLSQNYLGKLITRRHSTKLQFRFYARGTVSRVGKPIGLLCKQEIRNFREITKSLFLNI